MELAMTGGDPAEVLAETRSAIARLAEAGIPIVVYNATYDWPLLGAELERHALDPLPGVPPVILIDPLVLDRHLARFRKGKRTLGVVAAHYGVQLEGAHRADQDAEAAAALARAIAAKFPEVQVGGPELVAYQVAAHREWRDSFNEYMTRSGRAFDPITEVWPIGQPASP
jgi:DNA polymerase-3 subunit epsilon